MLRVVYRNSFEKPRIGNIVSFPGDNKVYEILDECDGQAVLSRVKKLPSKQYPSAGYRTQIVLPLDEEMVFVARGENRATFQDALDKENFDKFKALPDEVKQKFISLMEKLEDTSYSKEDFCKLYSQWFALERENNLIIMTFQVRDLIDAKLV